MWPVARTVILLDHATIPKQLPHAISALNHPYSRHTRLLSFSAMHHHR
jgi:hypothetical protein